MNFSALSTPLSCQIFVIGTVTDNCILQAQFGVVRYEIIGDDEASRYFSIDDESGEIILQVSVEEDTETVYQVL